MKRQVIDKKVYETLSKTQYITAFGYDDSGKFISSVTERRPKNGKNSIITGRYISKQQYETYKTKIESGKLTSDEFNALIDNTMQENSNGEGIFLRYEILPKGKIRFKRSDLILSRPKILMKTIEEKVKTKS